MQRGLTIRLAIFSALSLAAAFYLLPSVAGGIPSWWSSYLPAEGINLGLDLQGGSHLVLEVKVDKAVENAVERMKDDLGKLLKEKGIVFSELSRVRGNQIQLKIPTASAEKLKDLLKAEFPTLTATNPQTAAGQTEFVLALNPKELSALKDATVDQALETIRNRIDQFGVSEPIIQRHGQNDILVQLPGIQDPDRAKEIIGKTALLEFKLVDDSRSAEEALRAGPPPGMEILFGYGARGDARAGGEKIPYLLQARTLMTGDYITDARVRPRSEERRVGKECRL